MNPEQIKQLQQQLAAEGLYTGPIDGKMGPATATAAKAMQDRQNTAAQAESQRLANEQLRLQQQGAQQAEQSEENKRRREREDWEQTVPGQAYSVAKTVAPFGVGLYTGHKMAAGIENRQKEMAPETLRSMSTARRLAPFVGRAALLAPEGYYLREHIAPSMPTETGRELVQGAGNFGMWAGTGALGEGIVRSLTPPKAPVAPLGVPQLPGAPEGAALPPPSEVPPGPPPRTHSDRLVSAAKAGGASGKLTKESAADFLTKNVTDANRTAVAAELGVKSGPNFAKRIGDAVKLMTSTRGISSVALPLAAGAAAYSMGSSDAEAAGADPAAARVAGAKDAATATGGVLAGGYGLTKLLEKVPALNKVLSAAGKMSGPMMLNDLATEAYRGIYGSGPRWMDVPERNMGKTDEFATARALNIPENIPMPNPDGSSPYPELRAPMGAGPQLPQQVPPMPMRRPQLPYAPMGFAGRF